jgi:transposase InsO family protein
MYNNGSEFKLHFRSLCDTYGIKRKLTSVKNPQANAILERIHAVLGNMLRTSELDMAETVKASDIDIFLLDTAWAVCSTYHTVLKASPGAAVFGQDMLFDVPFIADWQKIGEHRQQLTDLGNARENEGRIVYDYKVGQKVLLQKEGILRNAESIWHRKPRLITSVHTN